MIKSANLRKQLTIKKKSWGGYGTRFLLFPFSYFSSRRRLEFLKRQLKSYSELDLFENEKTEKGAEIRNLKKKWHEHVMTLNALNKKLQQRVLQREAAMTKANSVVHLTTHVRDERNREIEELQKEIAKTRLKL
ncbi:hypothetical protein CAEBREN_05861 [Caenorhabditis brenneri]|uniref:Uncharacterized protein n=1 Tax=Caenorhabditis brenneri TaxID=135651 RepID=G0MFJ7_CAEBE|nr:hypothetical protein CAEBREN_05861 [Caenorhabditis brenneri]